MGLHTASIRSRSNITLLVVLTAAFFWQICPARAQTYSAPVTLYTFSGPDGEYPGYLTMDSQSNLYGATVEGGPAFTFLNGGNDAYGTIYKYATVTGTFTTLATFDGLDGYRPLGQVVMDGSGNLWGSTYYGGSDYFPANQHLGLGTIWEYSSTGVFTPGLVEFSGPDGDNPVGSVAFDNQGNLWGATYQGGIGWNPALGGFGNGTLFELPSNMLRTSPMRFVAPALPIYGPVLDSLENIFSTMSNGGQTGQGSLYEFSASGVYSTLVSFTGPDGISPGQIAIDNQGNLYGTTVQGGPFNLGILWKYSPSGGFTTLASFNGTNGQSGGALTVDASGNVFGASGSGGVNGGGILFEYATSGVMSTLFDFNTTANGANPGQILFDSQGNIYGATEQGGATGRGTLFVMHPVSTSLTVASVTVSPTTVAGGGTAQGTVTLSGRAPSGGLLVVLGSNSSYASPGGPVTVPSGATSANFSVVTQPVTATTTATIVARLGNSTWQTSLTVTQPTTITLTTIALNPSQVEGAGTSTGTVTLNGVAPSGGTLVSLSSDSSFARVGSSVTVPAGSVSANFTITTQAVSSNSFATITATLGSTSLQATLEVTNLGPIQVPSVGVDPATIAGGSSCTGIVSLSRQVPLGGPGMVVALSSSGPASVPASVTVPAGSIRASFPVSAGSVNSSSTATITASLNGSSAQGSLSIVPASSITLSSVILSSPGIGEPNGSASSATGGSSSLAFVNLNGPAPAGGLVITLSGSSSLVSMPPSVTIPVGNTSTSFGITTRPVTANTNVVVTATLGTTSQHATLTLTPQPSVVALSSFTLNPASVTGKSSSVGTATLNQPAPSGGTSVTFTSSNTAASVTASIIIPAGSTTGTVTITTQSVAAATTANIFPGTVNNNKEAVLTITPGTSTVSVTALSLNPSSVQGGSFSTGTVTLSAPAPAGGAVVSLSSNSAAASLPASVTVAAGATSASFTVNTQSVQATTSAVITATLGASSQQATLTITPAAAVGIQSLTLNPTSVRGGSTSQGTVTLSGPAPAGGALITLASNNTSVATVPSSVTIAAGKSSATFTVSTTRPSSNTTVTVSATYGGVTFTANLTVTRR